MRALYIHSIYIVSAWTFETGMFSLGKLIKVATFYYFLGFVTAYLLCWKEWQSLQYDAIIMHSVGTVQVFDMQGNPFCATLSSKVTLSVQENSDIMAILAK